MNYLEKLTILFSDAHYHENLAIAKATGTCVRCNSPADHFRDLPGKVEYEVSALCQRCQDELFNVTYTFPSTNPSTHESARFR